MRTLVIASGKGGVGKTTLAINVAFALNHYGRQVILVDGSFASPNVGLMLGKSNFEYTVLSAIEGKKTLEEVAYKHQTSLKIIPGDISIDHIHKKDIDVFVKKLKTLEKYAELVIIDTVAGIHRDTLETIQHTDDVILVTTPDFVSVTETLRMLKVIRQRKNVSHILGIVVNQYSHKEYDMTPENIEMLTEEKVIGIIPFHAHVKESIKLKHPVAYSHPQSPATEAFERFACNLIGKKFQEKPIKKTKMEDAMQKLGLKKWYDTVMKEADE